MERKELLNKANEMGLEFPKNITSDALADLIEDNEADYAIKVRAREIDIINKADAEAKIIADYLAKQAQSKVVEVVSPGQEKAKARKEAQRLIRCIVTSMDKDKAELDGEIISCANSLTGFIKKMVPFNREFHLPKIIVETLQGKKVMSIKTRKTVKGDVKEFIEIPAYNVQILPDLTTPELLRLKAESK